MADKLKQFPQISGMDLVLSTVVVFIVNVVVLFIAHMIAPNAYVLGTHSLSLWWAIKLSMGELALLCGLVMPFVGMIEQNRQKVFSPIEWSTLYLIVDVVGIWAISRFSEVYGLGVSSWMVVLPLAVALDVVQGMVMMFYGQMMKKMVK